MCPFSIYNLIWRSQKVVHRVKHILTFLCKNAEKRKKIESKLCQNMCFEFAPRRWSMNVSQHYVLKKKLQLKAWFFFVKNPLPAFGCKLKKGVFLLNFAPILLLSLPPFSAYFDQGLEYAAPKR